MNYEEFKKELYHNILHRKEAMGKQIRLLERQCICTDSYTLRLVKTCNLALYGNSEVYVREDMLCIAWEEWKVLRMLYWRIGRLYRQFLLEGWQAVLPGIVLKLQYGKQSELCEAEGDCVLERLIIRPLNYQRNQEELKTALYWRFGDIALVLYTLLYESGEEFISMKCSRDTIRRAGLPGEAVMVNALLQTGAMTPPRLYHCDDLQRCFGGHGGVFMPGDRGERVVIHNGDHEEGRRGYRLTNSRNFEGAAAVFYPGVQERLAEIMGGDYYIGFADIHEAVIHPVKHKCLNEMKAAVYRINMMRDERDVLSTRVYCYNSRRSRLFEV